MLYICVSELTYYKAKIMENKEYTIATSENFPKMTREDYSL